MLARDTKADPVVIVAAMVNFYENALRKGVPQIVQPPSEPSQEPPRGSRSSPRALNSSERRRKEEEEDKRRKEEEERQKKEEKERQVIERSWLEGALGQELKGRWLFAKDLKFESRRKWIYV